MDDSKTLLKHCHCEFVKRQGGLSRSTGNEWGIRKGSQSINCEILRAGRSVGPAVCPLRVDRRGHFRGFDQCMRLQKGVQNNIEASVDLSMLQSRTSNVQMPIGMYLFSLLPHVAICRRHIHNAESWSSSGPFSRKCPPKDYSKITCHSETMTVAILPRKQDALGSFQLSQI